jgi:hypothetical protein
MGIDTLTSIKTTLLVGVCAGAGVHGSGMGGRVDAGAGDVVSASAISCAEPFSYPIRLKPLSRRRTLTRMSILDLLLA